MPELAWRKLRKSKPEDFEASPDTGISEEKIKLIAEKLTTIPEEFNPLPKIRQLLQKARDHFEKENKIDWSWGEMLAYGSLLLEGHDVRLSGQDTIRGTFSHRHAIIYDENTNEGYNRLSNLDLRTREISEYIIHCFQNLPYWVLNMVTRLPIPKHLRFGKHSSVIFPMARKRSSISLFAPAKVNGSA